MEKEDDKQIRYDLFDFCCCCWKNYMNRQIHLLVLQNPNRKIQWSDMLGKLDFQEMVMFLQHLPTQNWTHQDLEIVLSRAYMWQTMFESSPNHLA